MRCSRGMRAGAAGAIGIVLCMGSAGSALAADPTAGTMQAAYSNPASDGIPPIDPQTVREAISPQITPWKQMNVERGDSLAALFDRAGLSPKEWIAVLDIGERTAPLEHLQPGDRIQIRKTPDGRLSALRYDLDQVDTLAVTRSGDDLQAEILQLHSETRRMTATGRVEGSLAQSLAQADVPAAVATQLDHIYRYRADLSRHMHEGDRFSVIYEAEYADNERVATGDVIAASIVTDGEEIQAFRAIDAEGDAAYYDADGQPFQPSLSRHPVAYERISSPFDPNRLHPILHVRRPHNGVDMAADRGTPIHAAGEGTVTFVGRKRGYGRVVQIDHFDGFSTRYAHMARFASKLHDGEHVDEGDIIGYVGATGEATGPHLHFEIRKDDVPHDPLTMPLPEGKPLSKTRLAAFDRRIRPLATRLDAVPGMPPTLFAANAGAKTHADCTKASGVNAALALAPADALKKHSLGDLFCRISSDDGA